MRPYVQVPNRKPHTLGTFKPKSKQTEATPKAVSTAPEKEDVPIDPLVATHRQGPAFSKKAPVEEHVSVAKIGKELLELEFPISLQKLMGISNEAREFLRKMVTKRKVPRHGDDLILERKLLNQFVYNVSDDERRRCKHACLLFKMWDSGELAGRLDLSDYETDEEPSDESKVAEPTSPEVLSQNFISLNDLPTVQYEVAGEDDVDFEPGAIICLDPVEQYVQSLPENEEPRPIVVARESLPLRAIYPEINSSGIEESLLDPGSQICSMSEEVAKEKNISYDPSITVFLQSANQSLAKTLGLARNVPFKIGNTIAYLQLHVIPKVAYKVLLGRPFDVVMSTEIHNSRNGDTTLILTDPNTGLRSAVHTYARGQPPPVIQRKLQEQERHSFQNSRIWSKTKENSRL
ncbi:hypothetical protein CC2G_015084 [Coprinopsis cinerea AmutBmut pab1-1]|nr:hypothetical protein CC2G_015084 [Coprinopsis cinerea AmutBmut pab1-1]